MGKPKRNLECGSAQPSLFSFIVYSPKAGYFPCILKNSLILAPDIWLGMFSFQMQNISYWEFSISRRAFLQGSAWSNPDMDLPAAGS